AMSRAEALAFIANAEGRICAKLYRRADGTLITRDCPEGLKITRRRKAKVAGAAFAAVMSIAASASAQDSSQKGAAPGSGQTAVSSQTQNDNQTGLSGRIVDLAGAAIAGIKVQVYNERTKRKVVAVTNETGEFQFPFLEAGAYKLKIKAKDFEPLEQTNIVVRSGESTRVDINLLPAGTTITVGILIESRDVSITQGTTTITLPN
ncbi:MAG: carboxypeptidase-like regulatory domain-containing protein, partial [Acidobacteria bacterium]|nr:carboxypeptidase-like regulatory domain-containing protein [Acidobacteriota bacterium]